jgi:hypothetical protein
MKFHELKKGMTFKSFIKFDNSIRYVVSKDSKKVEMIYLLIPREEPGELKKQIIKKEDWNSEDYVWLKLKLPTLENQKKYRKELIKRILGPKLIDIKDNI